MWDEEIIALYQKRDEQAIKETEQKYSRYLMKIAYNILSDQEDSKECVNETYLKAWRSIPPHEPKVLSAYLGKITRQLSIDLFRMKNREKRKGSEYAISICELEECVPDNTTAELVADTKLLAEAINAYLRTLSPQARSIFAARYYFSDSVKDIAAYCKMSESKVKSLLYRTRQGLKKYPTKEGYDI
ncbi:MAG: RNA polymerase sigma factor [Ruminococcaceae bacterium]|nr:RNA polymerase sigma factor [Oscillospiraceae bacterium]